MKQISKWLAIALVLGCLWVSMGRNASQTSAAGESTSTQDPLVLDRRISTLEQRFFLLENSMRRLEQQVSTRSGTPNPQTNLQSNEITLLRSEIETLKGHVQALDCAVAKLDERTLAPKLRQSADENSYKDPCRVNPENPLRLPSRR